jgi:hypothetical protein
MSPEFQAPARGVHHCFLIALAVEAGFRDPQSGQKFPLRREERGAVDREHRLAGPDLLAVVRDEQFFYPPFRL